ncbi:MAG: DUF4373 domain-containing protein [Bacteroides sp.]|nr:DUF4373 domain-containing protein [Bacteroides sp.]
MIHDKFIKHDAGAAANLKLMILIQKEGLKGYGAYWILMEALRVQDDLSLSVESIPVIARRFRVKPDFLHRIVYNYDLFVIEDEYFYSTGMINRMKDYLKRVHKRLPYHLGQTIQEDRQVEWKEKEKKEEEDEYDGDYVECIYRLTGLTSWIEQMGVHCKLGEYFCKNFNLFRTEFETYLVLVGEEERINTVRDAQRRFYYWLSSRDGKRFIRKFCHERSISDPNGNERL